MTLQRTISENHKRAYAEYVLRKKKEERKNTIIIYLTIIFIVVITSILMGLMINYTTKSYNNAMKQCMAQGNSKLTCEVRLGE